MKITSFEPKHIPAVVSLYHQTVAHGKLPYGRSISQDYFNRRIFDSTLHATDCSKIAVSDTGKIAAAAIANYRRYPGHLRSRHVYLNLLFGGAHAPTIVSYRRLIDALRKEAQSAGCLSVKTSLQWGGIWPGFFVHDPDTITFAEKSQARLSPGEIYVQTGLDDWRHPMLTRSDGHRQSESIGIGPYEYRARKPLYHLLKNEFGVGWMHEVMSKISLDFECFNGYGLANTYGPDDLFLATVSGRLCGFCMVQSHTGTDQGFFGPIGLTATTRGRGIGKRLVATSLAYLRRLNKKSVGLWTTPAIYETFYKKLGFYQTAETIHAQWLV